MTVAPFRLGDIVRHLPTITSPYRAAGVVVWVNGGGVHRASFGTVVQLSAGRHRITNCYDDCEPVPPADTTAWQRITAVVARGPRDNDGDGDGDEYGFEVMAALLPPDIHDDVFGPEAHQPPLTYEELAYALADHYEHRPDPPPPVTDTDDGQTLTVTATVDVFDVLHRVATHQCDTHGFTVFRLGTAVRADGHRVPVCSDCDTAAAQAVDAAFRSA